MRASAKGKEYPSSPARSNQPVSKHRNQPVSKHRRAGNMICGRPFRGPMSRPGRWPAGAAAPSRYLTTEKP
jgi:hypothetical protein